MVLISRAYIIVMCIKNVFSKLYLSGCAINLMGITIGMLQFKYARAMRTQLKKILFNPTFNIIIIIHIYICIEILYKPTPAAAVIIIIYPLPVHSGGGGCTDWG